MISFSNGSNVDFACAAGALAFDGRGWPHEWPLRWMGLLNPKQFTFVTKTLTWGDRKGNFNYFMPWRSVRYLGNGKFVNAIGNTNPGLAYWYLYILPKIKLPKFAISVEPHSKLEAVQMADLISLKKDRFSYIELNASCPNTPDLEKIFEIIDTLSNNLDDIPLVVKVSWPQVNEGGFIEGLDSLNVEAIHAINTIPWDLLHPDEVSPVKPTTGLNGGVSGPPIKAYALEAITKIKQKTNLPIIGGGGISSISDVSEFSKAGADAFSIGSLFIRRPWAPNQIISQWRQEKYL